MPLMVLPKHIRRRGIGADTDDQRLQCLIGDSERCKAIAMEVCMSYLDGWRFTTVRHLATSEELEELLEVPQTAGKALKDLKKPPDNALLWIELGHESPVDRLKQLLGQSGVLRCARVLLTCNDEATRAAFLEELKDKPVS